MSFLLLVRHSETVLLNNVARTQWQLSDRGRTRLSVLVDRLRPYDPSAIVSSLESKALQTAEPVAQALSIPLWKSGGLHEQERDKTPIMKADSFHRAIQDLFRKPTELVYGSETAEHAYQRFTAALNRNLIQHYQSNSRSTPASDKSLCIVSHGTVISLLTARITGMNAFELWQKLSMPAIVCFSLPNMKLVDITWEVTSPEENQSGSPSS